MQQFMIHTAIPYLWWWWWLISTLLYMEHAKCRIVCVVYAPQLNCTVIVSPASKLGLSMDGVPLVYWKAFCASWRYTQHVHVHTCILYNRIIFQCNLWAVRLSSFRAICESYVLFFWIPFVCRTHSFWHIIMHKHKHTRIMIVMNAFYAK